MIDLAAADGDVRGDDERLAAMVGRYWRTRGCGPTIDQMRSYLGYKTKARVVRLLDHMAARGLVRRTAGMPQTTRLTPAGEEYADGRRCGAVDVVVAVSDTHDDEPSVGPAGGTNGRRLAIIGVLLRGDATPGQIAAEMGVGVAVVRSDLTAMTLSLPIYESGGNVGVDRAELEAWMRRLYRWPITIAPAAH